MIWNRLVMAVVVTSMILPPGTPLARAQGLQTVEASPVPEGSVRYDLYQKNIDRMTMFVRDMRSHLDRTAFDFAELLDSLDYDADAIIAFSKQSIAFEQYPGVLRGPLGTLFSRAGNSIDQAIFLAKLLRDAGYEARVVGTELESVQAAAVLQAMKQPTVPAPPIGDTSDPPRRDRQHRSQQRVAVLTRLPRRRVPARVPAARGRHARRGGRQLLPPHPRGGLRARHDRRPAGTRAPLRQLAPGSCAARRGRGADRHRTAALRVPARL